MSDEHDSALISAQDLYEGIIAIGRKRGKKFLLAISEEGFEAIAKCLLDEDEIPHGYDFYTRRQLVKLIISDIIE